MRRNYLDQVIKPMYDFLKAEMVKKNVAGVLAEHIYKKNYDDINEFFWKRGIPTPLAPLFLGHFSPVLRRPFAVLLRFPASWRQDGENGRKMA